MNFSNIPNIFFEYIYHFVINMGAALEAALLCFISIIHAFIPIKFLNTIYMDGHFWRRK